MYERLLSKGFLDLPSDDLRGSGYVVFTLESAVWCFMNTGNYSSCVLSAVNLGEDTDTTAAVAGGLAGLYYSGNSSCGIPEEWLGVLAKKEEIVSLCDQFIKRLDRQI